MTQITSLLVVTTVLLTYGLHFTVREGGLIREIKLLMQELELKMRGGGGGGLMCEGGA